LVGVGVPTWKRGVPWLHRQGILASPAGGGYLRGCLLARPLRINCRRGVDGAHTQHLSYDPNPADDKIESYLETIDKPARIADIAEATGLSEPYVGKRCRAMAETGRITRHEGRYIIGHDIPGMESPVILNDDREHLLSIVREVAPDRVTEASQKPLDELRKFIKNELATSTYPLGNRKVSYAVA
jgi:DNA-binding Lrp family transcriptional regulator